MILFAKEIKIGAIHSWKKAEKTKSKRREQKEKIQKAFSNAPQVEIIPAKVSTDISVNKQIRVAAYCRVSTYEDTQSGSYELQFQHYREMIEANPDWQLAGIYGDEGASGTSMKKRIQFMQMIEDAKNGKIDLIITKSVNRFARNVQDCLAVVRVLKALSPPVGVLFETENLNTIESKNEFTLGVMGLVAQGESEQKSAAIIWSIIERFKKGIPIISTHNLLGYDKDDFGRMVIVDEEAVVIKYIYSSFSDGMNAREIARSLTKAHVPTSHGNSVWSGGSVLNILRNEKYCGDVLMQKTFTVDCFSHKKMKNTGQRPQYLLRDHHPAIIPRNTWTAIQELLKQRRRSSANVCKFPKHKLYISKVKSGPLKGFIVFDPKWKSNSLNLLFDKWM